MYERMLNKQVAPSIEDLTAYCGENAELFALMNEWLSQTYGTVQTIVFPTEINMAGVLLTEKRKSSYAMYSPRTMPLQ